MSIATGPEAAAAVVAATQRPAPPAEYLPDRLLGGGVAARATAAKAQGCDGQVSKVAHFANLDGEVGEDVEQVLPPAACSLVAVIAAALYRSRAWDGLDVIVHQCKRGVEVASVEGVNCSVREFDVLLRNTPSPALSMGDFISRV